MTPILTLGWAKQDAGSRLELEPKGLRLWSLEKIEAEPNWFVDPRFAPLMLVGQWQGSRGRVIHVRKMDSALISMDLFGAERNLEATGTGSLENSGGLSS